MGISVQVRGVGDVASLQSARPDLKVATPSIQAGHPNEAALAAHLNLAQQALSYGQMHDAVAQANFLGSVKGWRP